MDSVQAEINLTVLVCSYNRSRDLRALLESVVAQDLGDAGDFEVLVVDNNSPDNTRLVVEELSSQGNQRLRYSFEGRQGKSFALNTGLSEVRGEIVAIIDDDQIMPPGYLAKLIRAFRDHPEVAFVGGKVLPLWEREPPAWLTSKHWGPIGMADYGDEVFVVNARRPVCLLTCAFRKTDLLMVGGFRNELGVTGRDGIGSTEDADIQERLWRTGRQGLYLPSLVLGHRAPAERLTHRHFLAWHRGHGRFRALSRKQDADSSRARLFDVPGHMYREAAGDLGRWLSHSMLGNRDRAFDHMASLRFFQGYFRQRYSDCEARADFAIRREVARFVTGLVRTHRV